MSRKQKNNLIRILVALAAFIAVLLLPLEGWAAFAAFLVVYAIIGWDILWRAVRGIFRGQVFDENFLMSVATVGAIALGDYPEAVAVMVFYQVGEWFQDYAVGRSRRSISGLMDIRPDSASRVEADSSITLLEPDEIAVGDTILIKPGERIPLDGEVLEGRAALDTSALTGESLPREVDTGSDVISGCVNLNGVLRIRVTRPFSESTVARILDLVENSSVRKSRSEQFITRFSRYYTPLVCIAALILAIVPPLLGAGTFGDWIYRALSFLVISCPCALVISIPLSFFGGIGAASRAGVLVKGGNYLEALARAETVVFDKTGTLTRGRFTLSEVYPVGITPDLLLETAAYVESYSTHPIAVSVREAYGKPLLPGRLADVEELAGRGLSARLDGHTILAGNARLMQEHDIPLENVPEEDTIVHLAREGRYLGYLRVEDTLRPDAQSAVAGLRALGVREAIMLTGDNDATGRKVGAALGLDAVYTQLMPQDKVEKVEQLLARETKGTLAFVGDGVNDAPVLARADVGVAMGGLGSDAAIEAADIVIMTDEPSRLVDAVKISRKTLRIVLQNIVLALGVKGVVLVLSALGLASMWGAVFADVGVAVIAILNALRILYSVKAGSPLPTRLPLRHR